MNLALIKFILYGSLYVLVSKNFYVSAPSVFWNVNVSADGRRSVFNYPESLCFISSRAGKANAIAHQNTYSVANFSHCEI